MADSDTDISEQELQKHIAEILNNASLDKTSTKKVIQKLEKDLGIDLSNKKKLIDQLVMDYVNSMESDEESAEEEEPPKKVAPKKKKPTKKKKDDDEEDDERDDSNDSDWGPVEDGKKKPAPKSKKSSKKTKKGGVTKRRKGGSGYTKSCKLSPELAELMGESELPRHEVVRRVWAIIKEKQLYDPKNRQFAICDEALFKVIGEESFRTFSMMKYLKNHFLD